MSEREVEIKYPGMEWWKVQPSFLLNGHHFSLIIPSHFLWLWLLSVCDSGLRPLRSLCLSLSVAMETRATQKEQEGRGREREREIISMSVCLVGKREKEGKDDNNVKWIAKQASSFSLRRGSLFFSTVFFFFFFPILVLKRERSQGSLWWWGAIIVSRLSLSSHYPLG